MKKPKGPAETRAPRSAHSAMSVQMPGAVMATAPGPAPGALDGHFPIVGIGASAGGLAAFDAFLSAIPQDTESGMAFVLVQHLSPDHKSILSELCKRYTHMQVYEVKDGLEVQPNRLYIIPPSSDMALLDGRLHLLEPAAPRGLRLPIDFFFRSLAQERHEQAIGVVLSGTGSDGTLGARAIKGAGGMVMAQSPETAAYDGMPRSVIATGLTDFVLAPAEMPAQIMAYVAHAFGKGPRPIAEPAPGFEDVQKKICILLRDKTSHDFSQYKQSTLIRRIERRMALHQIERQGDYIRFLQQDSAEVEALFHDLLIGVTSFFRDPGAFAALESEVVPRLFAGKPAGATVRVWVCGCSTGEEAYSIAILLLEHLETLKQGFKIQVFATDLDARAIEQARSGVYPASIAADVSVERLARFFSQESDDGAYRVQKSIRDLLVFSEQDLIKDPPFSRLDLISCRNLLIYMNGDLQKRLIPLFHYALCPDGFLFLGTSETVGDAPMLFSVLSRKWKIYIRQDHRVGTPAQALGALLPPARAGSRTRGAARSPESQRGVRANLAALAEQALLRHYDPVAVLIDARGEILHIHGRTGRYLEPSPGEAAMNVLAMAREGLRRELTVVLHRAVARKESVRVQGIRVKTNGGFSTVDLTVYPAQEPDNRTPLADLYLVLLEPARAVEPAEDLAPTARTAEESARAAPESEARIAELELKLLSKEEYLQSTMEEMETANEELKSANEEMQSVNEELQSTNEELETSKEELQSVNEELATVNAELQMKVADLSRANNDMNNLLAGTGVATLFVDHGLRITRFTPAATRLIKLIQTDLGRPVGDIVSNLVGYDRLVEDVQVVLKTLIPIELEVETRSGTWYLMRLGPYRTLENVIEGAVITFVDITARKRMEDALRQARAYSDGIVDTLREALVVLDGDLRVVSANRAYYRHFRTSQAQTQGRPFRDLGDGQWGLPRLSNLLEEVWSKGLSFDDFEVSHAFPLIGTRTMMLNARRLDPGPGTEGAILIAMEDVTDRTAPSGGLDTPDPKPGGTDDPND